MITVKHISDNEIYLLIKYIKSALWRVAKRLSYTEDARCQKVKGQTCNQLRPPAVNKNYSTRYVRQLFSINSLEETLSIRTKPSYKTQLSISHLPHYSCVTVWEEKVSLVDPLGGMQLTPLAHQTATPSWECCASWENSSNSRPLTTIFSVADDSLLIFVADYTHKDRFTRGRQANPY